MSCEPTVGRRPRSLRTKLLLTVNGLMAVSLGLLLTADYRSEVGQRIEEKRSALRDEATTLLPSVVGLGEQGVEVLQAHVDLVCGRMQESTSPGHHIAVRFGGAVVQAQAHNRASAELFAAMESSRETGRETPETAQGAIVVGTAEQGDVVVYVSESVSDVLGRVRGSLFRRTLGLALVGLLGAAVVNVVLVRLVTRPLGHLVQTVRRIGGGQLGAQRGVSVPRNSTSWAARSAP